MEAQMTEQARKILGALFAVLGVYYCALGGVVLVRIPSVTRQWIERSGDSDFRFDYDFFVRLSGLGAALILLLGWRTVVLGLATARGRCPSWFWLAISAAPLHFAWWLYRVVGGGGPGRDGIAAERLSSGVQFGLVCVGYLLLWGMSRQATRNGGPANIALQPTAAASGAERRRG
jgi:hypothetical protein